MKKTLQESLKNVPKRYLETLLAFENSGNILMSNLMVNPLGFSSVEDLKNYYKNKIECTK